MYGDWMDDLEDRGPATEAEAHAEWHVNAGWPMDQPGCPWDCCDGPDPDWEAAHDTGVFAQADYDAMSDANRDLARMVEPEIWDDGDPENGPHLAMDPAPIDAIEDICAGIAAVGDRDAFLHAMGGLLWDRYFHIMDDTYAGDA